MPVIEGRGIVDGIRAAGFSLDWCSGECPSEHKLILCYPYPADLELFVICTLETNCPWQGSGEVHPVIPLLRYISCISILSL